MCCKQPPPPKQTNMKMLNTLKMYLYKYKYSFHDSSNKTNRWENEYKYICDTTCLGLKCRATLISCKFYGSSSTLCRILSSPMFRRVLKEWKSIGLAIHSLADKCTLCRFNNPPNNVQVKIKGHFFFISLRICFLQCCFEASDAHYTNWHPWWHISP